jgi:hypothetical protein
MSRPAHVDAGVRPALEARRMDLTEELARLTAAPEPGTNLSFGKRIGEGTTQAVERIEAIPWAALCMSCASARRPA